MSKSREQINKYLSQIDISNKSVLDVGVQNNPAKKYTKGEPKEYLTIDVDAEWSPDLVADLNEPMSNALIKEIKRFDVVFCLEVMEHCWNPIQVLKNLSEFTKEGGVCYISVPFINPIHDKWDYLRYTDEWFTRVATMVGFSKLDVKYRMAEGNKILEFYQEEGLRMSKIRHEMGDGQLIKMVGLFICATK